jgi:hypothetical protein
MKTACEEAADEFIALENLGVIDIESDVIRRLRAEGRELLMYRKLAHDISYGTDKRRIAATLALQVMASGLEKKARKAK